MINKQPRSFPIDWVRGQFPALRRSIGNQPVIYLDGPGGTQVPEQVIAAIADYLRTSNSNLGGRFATSAQTGELVLRTRIALAEFILTSLDHDANIAPWRLAAAERGVTVKTWEVRKQTCSLDLGDLQPLLNQRTALIAVTLASNASGSHVDVRGVAELAKSVQAKLFVDAVHFAPHARIDVQSLGCDFLVCSAYKFFGPHIGVLWGREELLSHLESFKVRPAANQPPGKWETGTQSFENIAGTLAALGYMRDLANAVNQTSLADAMELIRNYEYTLSRRFLAGVARIPRLSLYGITDPLKAMLRTPTFALRVEGVRPDLLAQN